MASRSFGDMIVRTNPSPTEKADIKEARRLVAELLNFVDSFAPLGSSVEQEEERRLLANAATCFEEGCMWLVKGLTVPKD